jgi:hypothetical protein
LHLAVGDDSCIADTAALDLDNAVALDNPDTDDFGDTDGGANAIRTARPGRRRRRA